MSKLFAESIDESNNTVSTLFTSAVFTSLPLYIPWVQPPPTRKYRISFNGDSTSFIESIVSYWRPEVSITNISNYTQPSNKFNLGSFWNYHPNKVIFAISDYVYSPYGAVISGVEDMSGTGWTTTIVNDKNSSYTIYGAAVDSAKKIYFTDYSHNRIFRVDNIKGDNLISFGSSGSGINQFGNIAGIYVDKNNKIYICDNSNDRIVRIDDMTGTNWTTYAPGGAGSIRPIGIFVDTNLHIYFTDNKIAGVQSMSDMSGTGLSSHIFSMGGQPFSQINGIVVDSSGKIYVNGQYLDSNNLITYSIVRIDSISGSNQIVFGVKGTGINQFNFPLTLATNLAIDSSNRLYIADTNNHRIVRIDDMTGTNWTTYGSYGYYPATKTFDNSLPTSVATTL